MIFNSFPVKRDDLFALNHLDSNSSLTLSELTRQVILFPFICTDVSSAYMIENSDSDALQILFIYIIKSRGTNIEPCGHHI